MSELSDREMKLLLNKDADVQSEFAENMGRAERRRLERVKKKDDAERASYGGKLCTRYDVTQILGLYIERNLLPMAQRLDALEVLVWRSQQWFWKRWWWAFVEWRADFSSQKRERN
jgi:hypothetical protein